MIYLDKTVEDLKLKLGEYTTKKETFCPIVNPDYFEPTQVIFQDPAEISGWKEYAKEVQVSTSKFIHELISWVPHSEFKFMIRQPLQEILFNSLMYRQGEDYSLSVEVAKGQNKLSVVQITNPNYDAMSFDLKTRIDWLESTHCLEVLPRELRTNGGQGLRMLMRSNFPVVYEDGGNICAISNVSLKY
jgi:hypothetical protein